MKRCYFVLIAFLLCPAFLEASPRFAPCFGENAVLQRGEATTVWGFDADSEKPLSVRLGDVKIECSVQADGKWSATFPQLKASNEERTLELVESGTVIAAHEGVVVGEVWLAAGQSNMQMQVRGMVKGMPPAKDWVDSATFPQIRFRRVNDPVLADRDAEAVDLSTRQPWVKMTPDTVLNFSATAAVFAREIAEAIDCPVGIIDVSWGGKPIEPFIPREAFISPLLSQIKNLADAEKLDELKALRGGVIIRNPEGYPGSIFNARMAPLTPYKLAGFLWYQAESNAGTGEDPRDYQEKMEALAKGWRSRWGDDSLPLNFVQLPSYATANGWVRVREEQRRALETPHSAMAVTIDIRGEGIHPPDKLEVGKRLARCALKNTYGKVDIVASGPVYENHTVNGNQVTVQFSETHGGLVAGNRPLFGEVGFAENEPLKWFEVAGKDEIWHAASAVIKDETVIVTSDDEPKPIAVRYACHTNPQGGNLYNRAGLPASPFCSNLELLGWDDPANTPKSK